MYSDTISAVRMLYVKHLSPPCTGQTAVLSCFQGWSVTYPERLRHRPLPRYPALIYPPAGRRVLRHAVAILPSTVLRRDTP